MPTLTIRRALAADAPALTAIANAAKAHWGYDAAQLDAWRDELTVTPDSILRFEVHLAEDDAGPVAFYALDASPRRWTLEHFWVHPSSMRAGIGRRMLEHAAEKAAAGGALEILIDADPNAEAFYLANGASRIGSMAAPIHPSQPQRRRPVLLLRVDPRDDRDIVEGHET